MDIKISDIRLETGWKNLLIEEFQQPYMLEIKKFLLQSERQIFPPKRLIFNALDLCPLEKTRVIILGQDPYHKFGQAMGLSFSVPHGVAIPPSLRNIYKELARTIPNFVIPNHGDLSAWASQGVLLLNSVLTVEAGKAGSHSKIGWQRFTDALISKLSASKSGLIFMLWGNYAKSKSALIDAQKHHILSAVHPSPLAGNQFIGCNHFAICNQILQQRGEQPIEWSL